MKKALTDVTTALHRRAPIGCGFCAGALTKVLLWIRKLLGVSALAVEGTLAERLCCCQVRALALSSTTKLEPYPEHLTPLQAP